MDESTNPESEKVVEEKTEKKEKKPAIDFHSTWAIVVVGLLMLFFGMLFGYFGRPLVGPEAKTARSTSTAQAIAVQTQVASNKQIMEYLSEKLQHFQGEPDSPVTIIEFSDFQCPYCGVYATGAGPQIEEAYVKQGKVRFGYWNYAILGDESKWAAEASECASDQGKFWEYHDILFKNQSGENQGAFVKDNLKKFANELGLDTQAFAECLDSGKYTKLVEEFSYIASQLGVRSTPSFLVNGQPVVGAQSFEDFKKLIDQLSKQ
jgi:protein-disulfide isomerase